MTSAHGFLVQNISFTRYLLYEEELTTNQLTLGLVLNLAEFVSTMHTLMMILALIIGSLLTWELAK